MCFGSQALTWEEKCEVVESGEKNELGHCRCGMGVRRPEGVSVVGRQHSWVCTSVWLLTQRSGLFLGRALSLSSSLVEGIYCLSGSN